MSARARQRGMLASSGKLMSASSISPTKNICFRYLASKVQVVDHKIVQREIPVGQRVPATWNIAALNRRDAP